MAGTTIRQRQIEDGAINDDKVQAGAGIVTSKLADGANFLKKDGSVTMTGSLNMGSQLITNVQTPSAGTDASNKNYVDNAVASLNSIFKAKPNCRAATTVDITLSNPATAVFDGITLVSGEYLLVKDQSAPAENGIYIFNGSGFALTRITQMDTWTEVNGAFTTIDEGSLYADTAWLCISNSGGTINTTAITWQQTPTSIGLSSSNFVDKEVPSGAINGVNVTYILANTPIAGSEHVYLNGMLQDSGAGNDYTITGSTITYLIAPLTGEKLKVSYRK